MERLSPANPRAVAFQALCLLTLLREPHLRFALDAGCAHSVAKLGRADERLGGPASSKSCHTVTSLGSIDRLVHGLGTNAGGLLLAREVVVNISPRVVVRDRVTDVEPHHDLPRSGRSAGCVTIIETECNRERAR